METTEKSTLPEVLEIPLSRYPGMNRFALDYVQAAGTAHRFLPRADLRSLRPHRVSSWPDLAEALIESNRLWANDVSQAVRRWQKEETIVLVAGQQVGFAGGPMYTLSKIASLLAMRRNYEAEGIPCTVLFWLATEDHDFDEVATLTLPSPDGAITISTSKRNTFRGVVGNMAVPDSLRRKFLEHMKIDRPQPEWLRPGITFRDSFGRLISEVFRGDQVILVDSLLTPLRRAGSQLFHRLIDSAAALTRRVAQRSEELEAAGYKPQVMARDGSLPFLFLIAENGERLSLRENGGAWMAGEDPINLQTLHDIVDREPQRISTGVLTRPLLQDAVLGPSIFVGGPAEVAYYAQIAPLHEELDVALPRVALRGHTLLVPERVLLTYHRHELRHEDIFSGPEEILARLEPEKEQQLSEAMVRAREVIDRELIGIRDLVLPTDKSLGKSIERSLRRIRYQVGQLEERGRRSILRRNRERFEAIRKFSTTLFPGGVPQDRIMAWVAYWFQYGRRMVERMADETKPDSDRVRIIGL